MLRPPHAYCTNTTARLVAKARAYLVLSISERTMSGWLAILKKYREFCLKYLIFNSSQILGSLPSTPETISLFLSHLAASADHKKPLQFSTIRNYLIQFSSIHEKLGFHGSLNPCRHPLCKSTLKGIQRGLWIHEPERLKKRIRKELTPDLLASLGALLPNKLRLVREASLWAALNCGVWAMLRSGEITHTNLEYHKKVRKFLNCGSLYWVVNGKGMNLQENEFIRKLKNDQWEIREDKMNYFGWRIDQLAYAYLLLSNTKTNQFSDDEFSIIAGDPPIRALWNYLKLRNSIYPTVSSDALFIYEWEKLGNRLIQSPLSYQQLVETMRNLISQSGNDPREFAGHSMRRGGATALANKGISKELIKQLGRWKSDAVDSYIVMDKNVLVRAVETMEGKLEKSNEIRDEEEMSELDLNWEI